MLSALRTERAMQRAQLGKMGVPQDQTHFTTQSLLCNVRAAPGAPGVTPFASGRGRGQPPQPPGSSKGPPPGFPPSQQRIQAPPPGFPAPRGPLPPPGTSDRPPQDQHAPQTRSRTQAPPPGFPAPGNYHQRHQQQAPLLPPAQAQMPGDLSSEVPARPDTRAPTETPDPKCDLAVFA